MRVCVYATCIVHCACALKYSNPFLHNARLAFLRGLWEIFGCHTSERLAINMPAAVCAVNVFACKFDCTPKW